MEVINSLYDNVQLLGPALGATSLSKPDRTLKSIIEFVDKAYALVESVHRKNMVSLDKVTLSTLYSINEQLDEMRVTELPINPTKDDIIDLLVPDKSELYYILLKNCILRLKISFFEQQELLQDLNEAILDVTETTTKSDISIVQQMGAFAFMTPFDYSSDDSVYDLSIDRFKESETYTIEYNFAPLIFYKEATKYGPLPAWTSGLTEKLVQRYNNVGPGAISDQKTAQKLVTPHPDTCISKKFFANNNGFLRRYTLFGKNAKPFQGSSTILQKYAKVFTDSTLEKISFDLEIEPPQEPEQEYPLQKGSYLQAIESLSKEVKTKLEKNIPLDPQAFYDVALEPLLIRDTLEKIIYTLYSNYLHAQDYELEVKIATYDAVETIAAKILRRLRQSIQKYIDSNAFLQPPMKRIESLMYAYELGLDLILKDEKLPINDKLILLKRASEQK